MKFVRFLTRAAIVLAVCGMLFPRGILQAAPTQRAGNDVALGSNGTLNGVLVTAEGKPLDGAVVSVRKGDHEISRAVSNNQGVFQVANLSSGSYDVVVGQQVIPVRAWSANVAPPAARSEAMIVVGDAVRGQSLAGLDFVTLATLTAATGALVLAAINQADLNDLEDKIDELASP